MQLQESPKYFVQLVLGIAFGYSVVISLLKWDKGNTGMTQQIRTQTKRMFPSVTICRMLPSSGNENKNLTELFMKLKNKPIEQHVPYLQHAVEMGNGYIHLGVYEHLTISKVP